MFSAICALLLALAQGSAMQAGLATWYDDGPGLYAAAGPLLRHGDWRGSFVRVCAGKCVTVQLTDWCACGDRGGQPTLLDLSASAFKRLAPLSKGIVAVEVQVLSDIPLPPTDTIEETP
jgi:rare lipoprotein A (peptidoglycan hydrolase)